MTHKALLAESLDLLRQSELREYELDQARQRAEAKGGNKANSHAHDAVALVRGYEALYQRYLCGLQIMNYVRHLLLATTDARSVPYAQRVVAFCVGKLTAYMDRAEQLLNKLNTVLVPVGRVDELTKAGYAMVNLVYALDGGAAPLTMAAATHTLTRSLSRGTYVAIVKNTDDYSVAAPSVKVSLDVRPNDTATTVGNNPLHAECASLPCGMAWRRVFGVSSSAAVTLKVKASGMRDAHIDVLLQQWCPASEAAAAQLAHDNNNSGGSYHSISNKRGSAATTITTTTAAAAKGGDGAGNTSKDMLDDLFAGGALPPLTDDEIAAMASFNDAGNAPPPPGQYTASPPAAATAQPHTTQSAALPLPHQQSAQQQPVTTAAAAVAPADVPLPVITVNPPGATTQRRLQTMRGVLDAWSLDGVSAAALPPATQRELQAMHALPLPRELDE